MQIRFGIALDRCNGYQRAAIMRPEGTMQAYPYRASPEEACGACGELGHFRRDCPYLKEGDVCEECGNAVCSESHGTADGTSQRNVQSKLPGSEGTQSDGIEVSDAGTTQMSDRRNAKGMLNSNSCKFDGTSG